MFLNLAPSAVGIDPIDFEGLIALAKRHHFGGIDLPIREIVQMDDPAEAGHRVHQAGLRWGGFMLPVDFRKDEATSQAGLESLRKMAPAAAKAGCKRCYTYILPFHDTLSYQDNMAQHVRRLKPVAQLLGQHGIRLGLEFVGPKTLRDGHAHPFIHTLEQVLELCDAVQKNVCGVLLDSWHWYTSGADQKDIVPLLRDRLVYIHVNDAPPDLTRDQQIDNVRRLPCETGVINMRQFLAILQSVGYDGPLTSEPFMPELRKLSHDDAAARTSAAMHQMLTLL